ncbi:hypothetical protein [Actinoplanes sp. NPDC049118]|uniref:DUF7144 family membrane protein n=1 Tax=Actinoplanes sp. NPDC049118 TaxID=3155769 RepID=UPI0033E9A50D
MAADQRRRTSRPSNQPTGWVGLVIFGGIMLTVLGGFQIIEGLVALFNDEYYVTTSRGLALTLDFTAWGWTHVLIGLVALAAGIGILSGQTWARITGIVIAVLSAFANMLFLAAYPVGSTIVIALDILVIYALAVHGREIKY